MILIDANLLLYACDGSSRYHELSKKWLEDVLNGVGPVRFAWVTLLAFLRISTDHRVLKLPLLMDEAEKIVLDWFELPVVDILDPTERHFSVLSALLKQGQVRGPLVMDAHLAALAIEHGAVLYTTDRDFTRFPDLKWLNPLGG